MKFKKILLLILACSAFTAEQAHSFTIEYLSSNNPTTEGFSSVQYYYTCVTNYLNNFSKIPLL